MNGHVDESLRALIDVNVGNQAADQSAVIRVWVDTAFDGFFVFPRTMIEELGLRQEAMTQAILADGREVTLESFVCYVEWVRRNRCSKSLRTMASCHCLGRSSSQIIDCLWTISRIRYRSTNPTNVGRHWARAGCSIQASRIRVSSARLGYWRFVVCELALSYAFLSPAGPATDMPRILPTPRMPRDRECRCVRRAGTRNIATGRSS